MASRKDTELSIKFCKEGNQLFKKSRYFEALECYNKSLCYAEQQREFAMAYGNRSAVYMTVKEHQLCLDNIRMAHEAGYTIHTTSNKTTLQLREEKCKNMLQSSLAKDCWSFFKLSYPAHEKIPFIVNCLDLDKNEKYGRHIITNQDLKPGDILAIEEPFFKAVEQAAVYMRCTNCLKSNKMSLLPTDFSTAAMFCSKECERIAEILFLRHTWESQLNETCQRILGEAAATCNGDFNSLKIVLEDSKLKPKTVFDLDFTMDEDASMYKFNQLLAFLSLIAKPVDKNNEDFALIQNHIILNNLDNEFEKKIAISFMETVCGICDWNCFGIDWHVPLVAGEDHDILKRYDVGMGILLFGSLFNHSCAHNVDRVVVDNKVIFYAKQFIPKGQQLFISYGPTFVQEPRELRQKHLMDRYGFLCSCEACEKNYKCLNQCELVALRAPFEEFSSIQDYNKKFKETCKLLLDYRDSTSYKMLELTFRNLYFLALIAKAEPFIFGINPGINKTKTD